MATQAGGRAPRGDLVNTELPDSWPSYRAVCGWFGQRSSYSPTDPTVFHCTNLDVSSLTLIIGLRALLSTLKCANMRRKSETDSCGCSTCMEQFAGHCHVVAIAADIQETTQDRTVCSQLSRLLAAATSDTCFFFSASLARLFHVILFVRCPRSL